jgi:hypothetical protein
VWSSLLLLGVSHKSNTRGRGDASLHQPRRTLRGKILPPPPSEMAYSRHFDRPLPANNPLPEEAPPPPQFPL